MNIILYKSNAEKNRMYKSSYLTQVANLTGSLRDGSSIIDPVIQIRGDASFFVANYMYIEEFNRYYFITDISVEHTMDIIISAHVDVLMSWNTEIVGNQCRVIRNEYNGDDFIVDDMAEIYPYYKVKKTFDYEPVTFKMSMFEQAHLNNDAAFVIAVRSYDTAGTLPGNTDMQHSYELKQPNQNISVLQGTNINYYLVNAQAVRDFVKYIGDNSQAASYVNGIWAYPYKFADYSNDSPAPTGTAKTKIYVNEISSEVTGFLVGSDFLYTDQVRFPIYQAIEQNYLFLRGTIISIQLPFYGIYNLDITKFVSLIASFSEHFYLTIQAYIDIVTGTINYIISYETSFDGESRLIQIDKVSTLCSVGIEFNVDNTDRINRNRTSDTLKLIGNILSSTFLAGGAAAAGFISGGPLGAAAGAARGLGLAGANLINGASNFLANRVVDVPYGTNSSNNSEPYTWFYYSTYDILCSIATREFVQERNSAYKHLCGIPCDIIDALSNFNGFTLISDVHLDNVPATSLELNEIVEILQNGILMPEQTT